MDVKVLFDKLNIIDGVKDDFTVKVTLDEDVFSVKVVSTSPSEKKMYAKADAIENSASGSIASFPDGANGVLMNSLIANIVPIQDLHGYANPWPAGGGKNLLVPRLPSLTQAGITMTNNGDGSFNFVGTATANTNFRIDQISVGSTANLRSYTAPFVMSMSSTATVGTLFLGGYNSGTWTTPSCPVNGNTKVTDNIDNAFAYIRFNSGNTVNATFYPQIESGSTATAWSPYSNICPISGRTGMSVYRTGKNLLDDSIKSFASGGYVFFNAEGDRYHKTTTLQAGTYTFSVTYSQAFETTKAHLNIYDVGTDTRLAVAYNNTKVSFTLTKITDVAMFVQNSGLTVSDILTAQLELGSTATTYEPYNGNTYAVDWTSEAGTVYGGTLDVVSGLLTVRYGITTFGQLNPNDTILPNVFRFFISGKQSGKDNFLCSAFKVVNKENQANYEITGMGSSSNVYVKDTDYSTAADFKTAFSDQQIVYELATPLTYQLTAQEVKTLFGQNCIWSDSGGVSVDYIADTKKYIDNKILQAIAAALNA